MIKRDSPDSLLIPMPKGPIGNLAGHLLLPQWWEMLLPFSEWEISKHNASDSMYLGSANFSCEESDTKSFSFCRLQGICYSCSILLLQWKSSYRQCTIKHTCVAVQFCLQTPKSEFPTIFTCHRHHHTDFFQIFKNIKTILSLRWCQ